MKLILNKYTFPDYNELLDGIAAVICIGNGNYRTPDRHIVFDLRDRTSFDDKGLLWYKGCFGNALIALRYAQITDKLYLLDNAALSAYNSHMTADELEKMSVHTIERSND